MAGSPQVTKRNIMDSRHRAQIAEQVDSLPRIERRVPEPPKTATPPWGLHLALGAGWLGFLYMIGFFSTSTETTEAAAVPEGIFAMIITGLVFIGVIGIFAILSLAVQNSAYTARISFGVGTLFAGIFASCGLEGHPVSLWGGSALVAAGLAAASAAVMARSAA